MDRAAGQHCRERKATRRRNRIRNHKRRHSAMRGNQRIERSIIAGHNLDNLVRMTEKAPRLRIFAKVKPRLVHVPESTVLTAGLGLNLVGR